MVVNNKLPLQPTSNDIWTQKHRLNNFDGSHVDKTLEDTFTRVATALAINENNPSEWAETFYDTISAGCYPAGRILSNAGAGEYKSETTLINCVVASNIRDSLSDILNVAYENGITLKTGAGIGFCFSTIRPNKSFVNGVNAQTSGPLSFADIYDKICFTISSAGGRRGSMMFTFAVTHPDVYEVIRAKREDGRLRQFNISLLITDDFIHAVKNDLEWKLYFPLHNNEPNNFELIYKDWSIKDDPNYTYNESGQVLCKVYEVIRAKGLWHEIMKSNYDYAEPGFILIDRINSYNNLFFDEIIIATNPCGEQPLSPNSSCLLGSINLTQFVRNPFTPEAYFDFEALRKHIPIFNRMLDNVVELANLPFEKQTKELLRKRRHGIGILGLGSTFSMLRLTYGSEDSIELTSKITYEIAYHSYVTGVELAKEKGPAPIMVEDFTITEELLRKCPELPYELGEIVKGKDLIIHSKYLQQFSYELLEDIKKYGLRYSHATSIAPTGTMAFGIGNNVSNGIEPSYEHEVIRNVIKTGKKTKEAVTVYSYEALLYKSIYGEDASLPEYFSTANTISPLDHINVVAAAQPWVDSSISKTINCPSNISFEEFQHIYMVAYEKGLKGCTTYRFNPESFQGVIVKKENLQNTKYKITLEDNSEMVLTGDELVLYDDNSSTVANLYDALKEGYYNKF